MTLKTEQNTRTVERLVKREAYAAKLGKRGRLQTDFEHGQWWVTDLDTGAQWSVCDSEPGPFCFEQVTQGDF